jgi:type 1 glutamine amidotransferase
MALVGVQQFVAASGTAERLVPTTTIRKMARTVILQAKKAAADNTGNVFIGVKDGVIDLAAGSVEYLELMPGDYWEWPGPAPIDLSNLWIDADTNADGVVGFYDPA